MLITSTNLIASAMLNIAQYIFLGNAFLKKCLPRKALH
ncbi:hypothetical protein GNIT_1943 [Glaciecola nitratireducens FR1064]|uniref:Uncharacterized protein n=1 Tax=Glaciecola nitratireducens (strain JCM 12485 / KCTC 12276 / FR1064) TaxID=1085623 RepID=G4QKI6_GLANF|nr:hypothetical protein GNIT_1943 [Glaciecola nitratireducens FR1064]